VKRPPSPRLAVGLALLAAALLVAGTIAYALSHGRAENAFLAALMLSIFGGIALAGFAGGLVLALLAAAIVRGAAA